MTTAPPPLMHRFSEIAADYDVLLCDIWGVIHNGVTAFPAACDALKRMRERDGKVILVTNAPRPSTVITHQLDALQVPHESYDAVVSSGDVTRRVIEKRQGQSLFHLGPKRDEPVFTGLNVKFATLDTADYVVCSGLVNDEIEIPDDYRSRLELMRKRNLFMLCANPDVVVERGDKLIYCAGAIADLYASMGGDVLYAGKPYRPIYDLALAKAEAAMNRAVEPKRILAIGDSVRTDLKGARNVNVDFLFITSGIHDEELGGYERLDAEALKTVFMTGEMPTAVIKYLVW